MDTHVALWWVNAHEKLSPKARAVLLNEAYTLYFSMASVWEVAIKRSLGKLPGLHGGIRQLLAKMEEMPICLLPLMPRHMEVVEALPFLHRDPFDRLLVAQAKAEGMAVLTADENIPKYDVLSAW